MTANVLIRAMRGRAGSVNPLWAGYLTFYKTTLAQEISDTAGRGFMISDEPLFALGGLHRRPVARVAHYCSIARPGPATATATLRIFTCRKMSAAAAWTRLIEEVYRKAEAAGASRFYWLTQSSNTQARAPL